MLFLATQGLAGCGKSTLSRALSRHFGWPLIDKDDIKDLLDGRVPDAGPLAYEVMFKLVRRQLLQGLSVICDSPLTGRIAYERAQHVAAEAHASLVVLTCSCFDEAIWQQRINSRKALQLPAHHQVDWEAFVTLRRQCAVQQQVVITHPQFIVDTARPLHECLQDITCWLAALERSQVEVKTRQADPPHGPRT